MKKTIVILILSVTSLPGLSQKSEYKAKIEAQGSITSDDNVPFWLRSNNFGSNPLSGPSASLIVSAEKMYDTVSVKLLDWGAGFEGRANGGDGSELILVEGFAKARLGIFELKGGRMKETFGLTDTLLTTGNFAISGNALGIPKVQIAIPEFYAIPIFGKVFAFKGVFAQGWLGEKKIQDKRVSQATSYFHQKALYIRLGKPHWRFKVFAGFNDQVFYGHEAEIFESFVLTGWEKYQSVVLGKNWAYSKVGNHAGNLDLRLEYDFDNVRVSAYRQSFYEVGALYHLANIADGINGISLQNKANNRQFVYWNRLLVEFLYSKNQAGEDWSKPTPTGNENYLNHYMYKEGWSYKGLGLGTPFITPANLARPGQGSFAKNYFINNRVAAIHFGTDLNVGEINIKAKLSYSKNFGTHQTRDSFKPVNQFSSYLDASKRFSKNLEIGAILAIDQGNLLNNSTGGILRIARHF